MDPLALGLPHRAPFVFIDQVIDFDPGISARAEKTFSPNDPVFGGHFPDNPVVPGVLLTEALAQTAGIAAAPEKPLLLSAIRSMKFPSAAKPDERIDLSARQTGQMGGLRLFEVRATVGDRVVAEGVVVLSA